MDIIYFSSCCSNKVFEKLREDGATHKLPQAQKYHWLLMEGISRQIAGKVYAVSAMPVNSKWTKQVYFKKQVEKENSITFIYNSFLNLPILRQITRYLGARREIARILRNNRDCVFVCDILNQTLASVARKCGKKYNIKTIGIVTDVPGYTSGARKKTLSRLKQCVSMFAEWIQKNTIDKYDAYLFLTEDMNNVVNKNKKPYIVLEGHTDSDMKLVQNVIEKKYNPKVAMYAGGIHREFGIARLVEAFINGKFTNWELHIYGDGNYEKELYEIAKGTNNVKYFGIQPNAVVVEEQLKATLLLNPRLTNAEYVKYSFPSKIMESMASGTPLCTTRLPGIPQEYYPYLYFFDDESVEGMEKKLKDIFMLEQNELHEFGMRAKKFVMDNKTNIQQAKRLVEFICFIQKI